MSLTRSEGRFSRKRSERGLRPWDPELPTHTVDDIVFEVRWIVSGHMRGEQPTVVVAVESIEAIGVRLSEVLAKHESADVLRPQVRQEVVEPHAPSE